MPRPEGPFERLLKQRPERDPAPIIIGGTIAFLAILIIMVFVFSSVFSGGGGNGGDDGTTIEVAPGVRGRLTAMPGLPPGLAAASQYIEFETDEAVPVTIALPLTVDISGDTGLGFYSFSEGRWQRIAESQVMPAQEFASQGCQASSTTTGGSLVSCGDFSAVPQNLAVLRVLAQTYTVAAALPSNSTLHGDARPNIVSPRDFTPASDGSIVGSATNVTRGEGVLLMPTIVGSSSDTASVVDDILLSEDLRAQHVQQITTLVNGNNLDGVDLEYSAVNADLAGEFTAFVTGLADALHRDGKRLSLTLPPPGDQRSAYEWAKLGEQTDYIKVLPIADPISYWDNMPGALGRLTEDVPPAKVLLVVSPFSIEVGEVARAVGYQRAMLVASEAAVREPQNPEEIVSGATVRLVAKNLDENEGASTLRWDNDASAVSFTTGGTDRRKIYIENSYSVAFKLELVQAYGLGGVAVSDGSAESDVANVWGRVNELVVTSTVSLRRPADTMLLPIWQAPEGGDLGAGAGTSATWVAPNSSGTFHVVLAVSDGDRRFGQQVAIQVQESDEPSASPIESFAPDTPTPTAEPSETPVPEAVAVQVGILSDGDDQNPTFTNAEEVTSGSEITYLVTIDNDSNVPVTINGLNDDTYGAVSCLTPGGSDVVGIVLAPDTGDGDSLDGGDDEVQCTFTQTAPNEIGVNVTNSITGTVQDPDTEEVGADVDTTAIITT
ncbi:MAG: glycosyl hydrolase family 18 protein [Dehalococcoidia bacterium]